MSTGQLYVVWSSLICSLANFDIRSQTRGLPLRNTSSEVGAPPLLLEVRIENDSDRQFSKSQFFKVFLETAFVHV